MEDSEFLSKEELTELTGHKQPKAQVRWLITNDFNFFTTAQGAPVVGRYYLRERMAGNDNETATSTTKKHVFQFGRLDK